MEIISVKRAMVLLSVLLWASWFAGTVGADSPADREGVAQAVTGLVSAYESRRPDNVLKLVSPRFVNSVGLEKALRDEYDAYHSIEVLSRVGPVVMGKDAASARVKWYRKRIDRKTGAQEKAEGEATLYFALEDGTYKLLRLDGEGFLPLRADGRGGGQPPDRR